MPENVVVNGMNYGYFQIEQKIIKERFPIYSDFCQAIFNWASRASDTKILGGPFNFPTSGCKPVSVHGLIRINIQYDGAYHT